MTSDQEKPQTNDCAPSASESPEGKEQEGGPGPPAEKAEPERAQEPDQRAGKERAPKGFWAWLKAVLGGKGTS